MRLLVVVLLLGQVETPGGDAVSLRFDGLHEITAGTVADPFKIKTGPHGVLVVGKPLYVKADFKPAVVGKRPLKNPDRRKVREVLQSDRLVINVQIPHADAGQKPLAVQGWLRPDFCCGKGLDGTFTVPETAKRGAVTLRITWPASGSLRAGATTVDVVIGP